MVDSPAKKPPALPGNGVNLPRAEQDRPPFTELIPPAGGKNEPPAAAQPACDGPLAQLQLQKLASVIEQIPIGVAITAANGEIEYVNPYLSSILGLGCREAAGTNLCAFRPADGARERQRIKRQLLLGNSWQGETQIKNKAGDIFHGLESVYALHDPDGSVAHFVHFIQDISGQKLAEAIRNLAFYDSLTGLPNRNLLQDRLARAAAMAERNRACFSVMYIDIDNFKQVNDTLGHHVGDELLRTIAARLLGALRESDTLARWGGDEFIAVLDNTHEPVTLIKIAEKLLAACVQPCHLNGRHHRATVSIGVSVYPVHARTIDALLKSADTAMYRAKAAGRNTFHIPGMPLPAFKS